MIYSIVDDWFYESAANLLIYIESGNQSLSTIKHIIESHTSHFESDIIDEGPQKVKLINVKQLGVIPSLNCNLRCKYCSENSTDGFIDLDLNKFRIMFDESVTKHFAYHIATNSRDSGLKLVLTGGGEPTLNWNLFTSIVDYSKKVCTDAGIAFSIAITTNAFSLSGEQIGYIYDNIDNILISYDGRSDIHDANRSSIYGPTSKSVESSIKHLVEMGKEISIRTVVRPVNYKDLKSMLDNLAQLTDLKKLRWDINPEIPIGRASNQIGKLDEHNTSFLSYFMDLVDYSKIKYGYQSISSPVIKADPIDYYCGAFNGPEVPLWLKPDGFVYTCIDCKTNPVAMVTHEGVAYETEYFDVLKNAYVKTHNNPICKKCIAYSVCKGGCPARIINFSEYSNAFSNNCKIIQGYWKYILTDVCNNNESNGWALEELRRVDQHIRTYHLKKNLSPKIEYDYLGLDSCNYIYGNEKTIIIGEKTIGRNKLLYTNDKKIIILRNIKEESDNF